MLQLPNNCYCTGTPGDQRKGTSDELPVFPKNWKTVKASCNKDWYIMYRFYDPSFRDANGNPRSVQRMVKGMNQFKTPADRRKATLMIMYDELQLLQRDGFNPIKNICTPPEEKSYNEIHAQVPFLRALTLCYEQTEFVGQVKLDIKSVLKYVDKAARLLSYHTLTIGEIKRRHIKTILNKLGDVKQNFSANNYNTYRKYLSILFTELMEYDAVDSNVVKDIKKKKVIREPRKVLTEEQCKKVDEFVRNYDPRFWMLVHIFYHSGARTTEMFRLQGKHVDLQKQSVRYQVMKGRDFAWVERPIADEALPFWRMAMEGCGPNDFVFSSGLMPGPNAISPRQMNRRWKRHIKDKLKIDADWYALKHLNTTRNVDAALAEIRAAQLQASAQTGHASEKMIAMVYDIRAAERMKEGVKKSTGFVS